MLGNLLCYDCHLMCERSHSLRSRHDTGPTMSSSTSSSAGYASSSLMSPIPTTKNRFPGRGRKSKPDKAEEQEEEEEEPENEDEDEDVLPMPPAPAMEEDPRKKYQYLVLQSDGEKNQSQALTGKEDVCEGVIPRSARKEQDIVFSKYPAGSTLLFTVREGVLPGATVSDSPRCPCLTMQRPKESTLNTSCFYIITSQGDRSQTYFLDYIGFDRLFILRY